MATQRAVVHKTPGVAEVSSNVPLPKLQDDYILVKTKAVALNPTDWKSLSTRSSPGAKVGCDYSGIVEAVGKNVTNFKEGDKVAGMVHGAHGLNHDDGAFAEHITAKAALQTKIADHIPFEDAATLGVGITTVGQGLYQSLGLPLPPSKVKEPTPVLIYGASTATGTLAVQFAKLSGAEVIATASPHNFNLLKSLGADQIFDYRDPDVGKKIREATNDKLQLVFDCISEKGSPEISAAAISSKGGHYSSLLPVKEFPRSDVTNTLTMAYTAMGYKFAQWDARPEDLEFARKFWALSGELLNSGKLKTHPIEARSGGLEGILQGLQDLKGGKASGVKLVYKID